MYKWTKITVEEIERYASVFGAKASVYFLIKMFAGSQGVAYPSQQSLSKLTGFSVRAIRKALKQLQQEGMISHVGYEQGLMRTAKYRVGTKVPTPQEQKCLGGRNKSADGVGTKVPTNKNQENESREEENENENSSVSSPSFSSEQLQNKTTNQTKTKTDLFIDWDQITRI